VGQCLLLSRKWFPKREPNVQSIGEALYLEQDYWQKMTAAITNGIGKAFNGK